MRRSLKEKSRAHRTCSYLFKRCSFKLCYPFQKPESYRERRFKRHGHGEGTQICSLQYWSKANFTGKVFKKAACDPSIPCRTNIITFILHLLNTLPNMSLKVRRCCCTKMQKENMYGNPVIAYGFYKFCDISVWNYGNHHYRSNDKTFLLQVMILASSLSDQ